MNSEHFEMMAGEWMEPAAVVEKMVEEYRVDRRQADEIMRQFESPSTVQYHDAAHGFTITRGIENQFTVKPDQREAA